MEAVQLSTDEITRLSGFKTRKRSLQWMATRCLLQSIEQNSSPFIAYNEHGKPHLANDRRLISLSHSDRYAAVQLCRAGYCGVDIQQREDRMTRLADKFLHRDEYDFINNHHRLLYLNLIWAMKEAIFKHFGSDLAFGTQIIIHPFDIVCDTEVSATASHQGQTHTMVLRWHEIGNCYLAYLC
ncbi:MAG: 4'-phosphopantetheinyl transferase superfamily protein [Cryomorphaceae bacterium]|nr:MAG: 4'-phosphopantetheinyl transferase superfamily protein [Cryomorphaceae bacterium]